MTPSKSGTLKCILALGFILVLAGCATNDWYAAMNKDWDEAQAIDTIDGYLNFLNKHPYSPQAKLARKSYFKLLEEQEGVPHYIGVLVEKLFAFYPSSSSHYDNPLERAQAAYNLGERGPKAACAVPFLATLFNDVSFGVWENELEWKRGGTRIELTSPGKEAIRAMVKIGDARAIEPLIAEVRYKEHRYRRALQIEAMKALVQFGDIRAVEALITLLEEGRPYCDEDVLVEASVALGEFGDIRAVEPLIDAFKFYHFHTAFRSKAAETLGKLGDDRAVEPLIASLKDGTPSYHTYALAALQELTGEKRGRDWWNENRDEVLKRR